MDRQRNPQLRDVTNQPVKRPRVAGGGSSSARFNSTPDTSGIYLQGHGTKPLLGQNNAQPPVQSGPTGAGYQSIRYPQLNTHRRNEDLKLSNPKWNLDPQFVAGLRNCGIEEIYEWQAECLSMPGLLEGERNLVYTAPTSAGKSLVAEILMIKKVMETQSKAIVVLPYVSIVTEKVKFLKRILEGIEPPIHVIGLHGGSKFKSNWKEADIVVCTIERANIMVNTFLEEGNTGDLGSIVFDELHMVEDGQRGYILEVLATKLLCLQEPIQMIGMSATLSNISEVAAWLQASSYNSTYRPIPLREYVVYENEVYDENNQITARIPLSEMKELQDPVINAIVSLVYGCVVEGYSALVFCPTRESAERRARLISQFMPPVDENVSEKRKDVLRDLASSPSGLDRELEKTIPLGVAFHHAGLTTEERDFIAEAYDNGLIKTICCTPTMAAGVNLPARRVIISPRTGRDLVSPAMLRQMRGRAGRKGKDTVGESYLCCPKIDRNAVKELLKCPMPRVKSAMPADKSGLQRALLEVIATGLATSDYSLEDFIKCTLLYHTSADKTGIVGLVQSALASLVSSQLITDDGNGVYGPTAIGQATVASGFGPDEGVHLHRDLSRALKAFNLETDMHITYTFTPIYGMQEINWKKLRDGIEGLDDSDLRTAIFVGVQPALVNRMAQGGVLRLDTPENVEKHQVHQRFYVALMLRDLINEMPVYHVALKYDIARGFVQTLASTCQGFANTTGIFCNKMGWSGFAALLKHYSTRLDMGTKDDLLDLVRLPYVKGYTARVIYSSGLKSISAIAAVDAHVLVPMLRSAQPQRSKLREEEEAKLQQRLMERAEIIVKAAQRLHAQEQIVLLEE